MAEQVDVVVLGLGVGGEELADSLAESGLTSSASRATWLGASAPTTAVFLRR
jgi:pyruvate/2-oxoglutarate dehydrogenase complex dihydrolipoamide dehydrogenase (E3) component